MKKLMTNHPKDAHISDSASGGTEETMASEIREENKVREKLVEIIRRSHVFNNLASSGLEADAILQSPDLRVTLVEPRYYVRDLSVGYAVVDREQAMMLAEFVNGGLRQTRAREYAQFLNSKEPK